MNRLLLANLFLLSLTVLHSGADFPPFPRLDAYGRIESYLAKNGCTPEKPEYNIEKAKEMLEGVKRSKCPFNFGLKDALEKFISVAEFKGESTCNQESTKLQEEIDKSVGYYGKRTVPLVYTTRKHYKVQHAADCRAIYPTVFKAKYPTMDKSIIAKVETFMRPEINYRMKKSVEPADFVQSDSGKKEQESFDSYVYLPVADTFTSRWAQDAYNSMKFYSKDDPEWKSLDENKNNWNKAKNNKKLEILFQRHVIEPCKYYTEQLGPVFEPAIYDEDTTRVYKPILTDESPFKFYWSWACYQGCAFVLEKKLELFSNQNSPISLESGSSPVESMNLE